MTQTSESDTLETAPSYWMRGVPALVANGLCGVIAIFVAIKAVSFEPHSFPGSEGFDHFFRITSFAALTVWVTFAIGLRRRGVAAIMVLAFAAVLEFIIVPMKTTGLSTVASANLGIVLAYGGAQLYWFALQRDRKPDRSHPEPA